MLTSADLLAALTAIAKRGYMDHESGPWTLDDWALTADGHIALLVPRQSLDALPPTPEKIATPVRRWMTLTATPMQRLEIAKLRAFATGPTCSRCKGTRKVRCAECDGSGHGTCECAKCGHEHTFDCDCVDGKATCDDCRSRVGVLLGKKINTHLLNDVLVIVGDERDIDAAVANLSPGKSGRGHAGEALILKPHGGEPWVAFIMPMVDDTPAVCAYDEPAHVSRP